MSVGCTGVYWTKRPPVVVFAALGPVTVVVTVLVAEFPESADSLDIGHVRRPPRKTEKLQRAYTGV